MNNLIQLDVLIHENKLSPINFVFQNIKDNDKTLRNLTRKHFLLNIDLNLCFHLNFFSLFSFKIKVRNSEVRVIWTFSGDMI